MLFYDNSELERMDRIEAIYYQLCPMGQKIMKELAERLMLGQQTHGDWKPKAKTRRDKLEEMLDAEIYTTYEMIEDTEDDDARHG